MDSPPSKRFRENGSSDNADTSTATVGSNDETSNEDHCTIPPLVSDIFLDQLRDVKLLKICRLVCTSWNIVACRSLKTCSLVRVLESSPRLTDLTAVLLRRSFGALKDLSSPFQNFHAEGKTFTDPSFTSLVVLPNVAITSMTLMLTGDELDQSQLERILAVNRASITDLKIVAKANFDLGEELLSSNEISLLSLKCLDFTDTCVDVCTHIPLMENILNLCMPDTMNLDIRDDGDLISLLTHDKAENLKDLALKFGEISEEAWEYLVELKFIKLRKLKLMLHYPERYTGHPQLHSFCYNVSSLLENFTTNIRISSEFAFPSLKTMNVWNINALSDFTPERLPSLETIVYNVQDPLFRFMEDAVPHEGVKRVSINLTENTAMSPSFDQDFMIFLTHLSRQFPKVDFLEITIDEFHGITLTDVCESFPKVTILRLDGVCDFCSFTGIDISFLNKYLELGRPVEKIPRRKSILDFIDLKIIWFGPNFVVDSDMITHGLSKITTLICVALHWNDSLSAPLLRDALGHLGKIVILNSTESRYEAAMAQLSQILPSAHLV